MIADFDLKLEDLLREHVDLRILFLDLFREFLQLGSLAYRLIRRRRHRLGEAVRTRKGGQKNDRDQDVRGAQCHGTRILPSAAGTGKRGRNWERETGLPLHDFSLNFLHAGARAKTV